MTDPVRREILELLVELSAACPDVRLGQLITNLSYKCRGLANDAAWEVEDAELVAAAREHLAELEAAHAEAATSEAG